MCFDDGAEGPAGARMIGPPISASGGTQILVATKPVDFRKQADSLAALVQEALGADPFLCVERDYVAANSREALPTAQLERVAT